MSDPTDISTRKRPQDHKPSKKKPVIKTVYICNDSEISDEHEEVFKEFVLVQMQVTAAAGNAPADIVSKFDQLKAKEAELRKMVRENSIRFRFKSIGRKAYEKLQSDNPPTEESKATLVKGGADADALDYDPDKFFPALCKACLVEPEDFDIEEAWTSPDWNMSEIAALATAAQEANTSRRVVQLGND